MAVMIDCNGKMILNVRNAIFEMIYTSIIENIENNNIKVSPDIELLIDKLYVACHGIGTDLAYYLKTHEDIVIFANLVKEAIEESENNFPDLLANTKNTLWNFHKAILNYAEELS